MLLHFAGSSNTGAKHTETLRTPKVGKRHISWGEILLLYNCLPPSTPHTNRYLIMMEGIHPTLKNKEKTEGKISFHIDIDIFCGMYYILKPTSSFPSSYWANYENIWGGAKHKNNWETESLNNETDRITSSLCSDRTILLKKLAPTWVHISKCIPTVPWHAYSFTNV